MNLLFFDIHMVSIVSSVSARKLKCSGSARNLLSLGSLEPENSSSNPSLPIGVAEIEIIAEFAK